MRAAAVLFLACLAACASTPPRFRYSLLAEPELPPATRRQVDSLVAESDRLHDCPPRADTVWAADRRVPIPPAWLRAAIRHGCGHASLPLPVRRRLRDDPASLRFFADVVEGRVASTENERMRALRQLGWSGHRRFLPLLLRAARNGTPAMEEDYNTAYVATVALASFAHSSPQARDVILRAATHPTSALARTAGIRALATVNDGWAREVLADIPLEEMNDLVRSFAQRALARKPCRPGTVNVEYWGVEGQDFAKCEPPPDLR